jgi:uncharacterized membrane protein
MLTRRAQRRVAAAATTSTMTAMNDRHDGPWHIPEKRTARLVRRRDVIRPSVNLRIAVVITAAIGTMWAFYAFALLMATWIGWQQTGLLRIVHDPYPFAFLLFLGNIVQLLLMPLIMVGQNVQGHASDARAEADYEVNKKAEVEIEKLLRGLKAVDDRTLEIVQRLEAMEERRTAEAGER